MASGSLNKLLHSVADAGRELFRNQSILRIVSQRAPEDICRTLLSTAGEASGVALARDIVDAYNRMPDHERLAFFLTLRSGFHVNTERVIGLAEKFCNDPNDENLARLQANIESPRQELFRRMNMAPDGTPTLVAMRGELLRHARNHPELKPVANDLAHLFSSWFNRGFLTLQRIDWNTPAAILDKVIEHESVHEITGWDDLRGRLQEDRRCFAFFHGALPGDPLIFVEVALVTGLPDSIGSLIDHARPIQDPQKADTAVFYSINNCHAGLQGISFGNFLIKQVVLELKQEFPQLGSFATLSPAPGFKRWLNGVSSENADDRLSQRDRETITQFMVGDWWKDNENSERIKPILMRLAAHYFLRSKSGKYPSDPVARFHLRNGARLERINWLGDTSRRGLEQSGGILVNYLYDLQAIERNHESYIEHGSIAAAPAVTRMQKN